MSTGGGITSGPGGAGGAASAGGAGQVQASDGAGAFQAPANVLAGASFISIGATPATANALRLANALYVASRNAANSANAKLIGADSSDICQVGDVAQSSAVSLNATTYCYLNAPATYVSPGAAHASVGDFRYNNVSSSYFRNAANSADVAMLASDASDQVWIGSSSAGATVAAAVKILNSRLIVAPTLTTSANPIEIGTTVAQSGTGIRVPYNGGSIVMMRNSANSADLNVVGLVGASTYLGDSNGDGLVFRAYSAGIIYLQLGGVSFLTVTSAALLNYKPIIGDASPYSVHGTKISAMTDAAYTVPSDEYSYSQIEIPATLTLTANRAFKLPTPATEAASYSIEVSNLSTGAFGPIIGRADGAGATYTLLTGGQRARFKVRPAGVYLETTTIT